MENDNLTERLESVLRRILHGMNAVTRSNLAQFDLSLPRLWVLTVVWNHPETTMGDLTERLYLAKSTVTGLVDELVEKNLLERRRDRDDRRVVRLLLTGEGEKLLQRVLEFRQNLLAEATAGLAPDALQAMVAGLEEIADRMHVEP